MNHLKFFSYLVTTKLIVLAAIFHSAPFAYAAVISLLLTLGREAFTLYMDSRTFKNALPDEAKKKIHELEARVTSIEMGIRQRGF